MGEKGGRSMSIFSMYFSGVMGHLLSTSKKARGHILGLLFDAEEKKNLLALEGLLQICRISKFTYKIVL